MALGTPKTDRTVRTKLKRLSVYSLARQRVNVPLANKQNGSKNLKRDRLRSWIYSRGVSAREKDFSLLKLLFNWYLIVRSKWRFGVQKYRYLELLCS